MAVSAAIEQWRGLVASIWPSDQVDNALAVMGCESGGNQYAHNTNGEDSRGLMQINVGPGAHSELAGLDLFDPATNLRAAYQIWQSSGWGPWTCAHTIGIVGGSNALAGVGNGAGTLVLLLLAALVVRHLVE